LVELLRREFTDVKKKYNAWSSNYGDGAIRVRGD
jgi:hypothetical protein